LEQLVCALKVPNITNTLKIKKCNPKIIIINKDYNNDNNNNNGKLTLTCAVQLINTHLQEGNILRIDSYHLSYPK
jgi:hypothetical protein